MAERENAAAAVTLTCTIPDEGVQASNPRWDSHPVVCFVCRRRADTGFGWAGHTGRPVMWRCSDRGCAAVLEYVCKMPKAFLDQREQVARDEAGEVAGAYLDRIGKTDLATLTQDEWRAFLDHVLVGFEHSLRQFYLVRAATR